MKIQLKHSNVLDTGAAKQPTAPNMLDGEIAVNFNATDPAIFIKNSDGNIVRIAGKDNLSFTGYETSIQAAATPPSGLVAGNLYFDTDDNRLYYYYDNGTTQQWVDASTEKFDVTIIPDPTNLNHQSGTLDDRYVNSNGDTMTGNLVLNAGVNLNSSDVYLNNGKVVFEGANANAHEIRLTVVEPTADRVISLPDVTGTLVSTGDSGTVTSGMIADGTIQNSDVSNSAAIGLSKLATGALPSGITVASTNIVNGTIVDADINSSAAIALTKLGTGALPSGITIASSGISGGVSPTDIAAGALPNNVTVVSANIVDGSIVNADISNTASIQVSKLADGNSYQLLQTNAAGNGVEWTSNIDVPGTLDVTGISTFDDNLTVAGNLAVTGSTVSLDANIVTVKDGNIQLGVVSTPTDVTADGGGITLKGSTDKTLSWINSTDAWTSSEHFNLATGKAYYVNGSEVLNGSSLGSSVTGSSLTGLGTISSGVWQGTQIVDTYLATITGTGKVANSATSATNLNSGNAIVSRDGSGDFTARNVTAALIGNASTASALENARTIALTGDLTGSASFDGSSNISISTTATFTGTTNLTYNSTTRKVESDTGTDATIPLFSNTVAGLAGASGGGTVNYLRADGSWASPPGTATNLGYTAATSTITSSTGTGVAIPNFSSTNAGFVQGSGGGTTKFLRADGNWIALGSSSTSISTSPPSNPNAGDSWFDTDEGRTYIYYQDTDSSQWVEANPSWNGGIPTGSVTPGYLSTGGPNWDASGNLSATGSITAASGVISGSLTQGGNNVVTVGDTGTVTSTMILDGTIVNTDINSAAAIALNKLASGALPSAITIGSSNIVNGTIVDADISTSAAISLSKLSSGALPSNITVTSSNISDLSIVNTDVNASAAIAGTKISPDFGSQNVLTTGSLGVGTTSPDQKLHVYGNSGTTLISVGDQTRTAPYGYFGADASSGKMSLVSRSAHPLTFQVETTEVGRFDTSGRLLVGTSSALNTGMTTIIKGSSGGTGVMIARASNPSSGQSLGTVYLSDHQGGIGAYVDAARDGGTWTSGSSHPTLLRFATTADGASSPTERMRIDNSGEVEIGGANYLTWVASPGGTHRGRISCFNNDSIVFQNTSSDSERMRIDSSGRVGIGDSAPDVEFSLKGTSDVISRVQATDQSNARVRIQAGNASSSYLEFGDSDDDDVGEIVYGHSDNHMRFRTNGSERLRIDSSGDVGIGTNAPDTKLQIENGSISVGSSTNTNSTNTLIAGYGYILSGTKYGNTSIRSTYANSNNAASLEFYTASSGTATAERMRINSSGSVGIGTSSPAGLLHIASTSGLASTVISTTAGSDAELEFRNTSGGNATWSAGLDFDNSKSFNLAYAAAEGASLSGNRLLTVTTGGNVGIGTSNPLGDLTISNGGAHGIEFQPNITSNVNRITNYNRSNNTYVSLKIDALDYRFNPSGTERMRIDSSGRLLVGTSSSSQVNTAVFQGNSSGGSGPGVILASSINNPSSTQVLGKLAFSDNGHVDAASIKAARDYGTWTSGSSQPSSLAFFTTADGSSSPTERMRISNDGSLNTFSTTSTVRSRNSNSAGTTTYLFLGYHSSTNTLNGTNSFRVSTNGDVTNTNNIYTAISDVTLKENIVPAATQWDNIKDIEVVNYNFKEETGHQTHKQLGVIAQQVEEVSPGLVNTDEDGLKSVSYSVLYMKAVKALQEAMERIETLEQRLTDAGIA